MNCTPCIGQPEHTHTHTHTHTREHTSTQINTHTQTQANKHTLTSRRLGSRVVSDASTNELSDGKPAGCPEYMMDHLALRHLEQAEAGGQLVVPSSMCCCCGSNEHVLQQPHMLERTRRGNFLDPSKTFLTLFPSFSAPLNLYLALEVHVVLPLGLQNQAVLASCTRGQRSGHPGTGEMAG
jgi:hypothetical protein